MTERGHYNADNESSENPRVSCPCGGGLLYKACCGRYIAGTQKPDTAEELMRSRFTAYVLGQAEYIQATTHPDARSATLLSDIEETIQTIQWRNLRILSTHLGSPRDKIGKVEFQADYTVKDKTQTHHERSRFRRFQGTWHYLDAQ